MFILSYGRSGRNVRSSVPVGMDKFSEDAPHHTGGQCVAFPSVWCADSPPCAPIASPYCVPLLLQNVSGLYPQSDNVTWGGGQVLLHA